jgi:transcriptional regulator with XRE-family HTH domain
MAVRRRRQDIGAALGRSLVALVGREFFLARTQAGLSQEVVSAAAGLSRSQYGRIERGEVPEVSILVVARVAAVLGLDTSLRFYPVADPVRDAPQHGLLERLHGRLHRTLQWSTEVPFARHGDLRAWDAVIAGFATGGARRRCGVEAETRPTDAQALDRKLALKIRDGGVEVVVLVLSNTRHNRAFLRGAGSVLRTRFPGDGRRALELLSAGVMPESNSIILL